MERYVSFACETLLALVCLLSDFHIKVQIRYSMTSLTKCHHFQSVPYIKTYCMARLGMQHKLFVILLYCFCSDFAINTGDCNFIFLLHILYIFRNGGFGVGVGLSVQKYP